MGQVVLELPTGAPTHTVTAGSLSVRFEVTGGVRSPDKIAVVWEDGQVEEKIKDLTSSGAEVEWTVVLPGSVFAAAAQPVEVTLTTSLGGMPSPPGTRYVSVHSIIFNATTCVEGTTSTSAPATSPSTTLTSTTLTTSSGAPATTASPTTSSAAPGSSSSASVGVTMTPAATPVPSAPEPPQTSAILEVTVPANDTDTATTEGTVAPTGDGDGPESSSGQQNRDGTADETSASPELLLGIALGAVAVLVVFGIAFVCVSRRRVHPAYVGRSTTELEEVRAATTMPPADAGHHRRTSHSAGGSARSPEVSRPPSRMSRSRSRRRAKRTTSYEAEGQDPAAGAERRGTSQRGSRIGKRHHDRHPAGSTAGILLPPATPVYGSVSEYENTVGSSSTTPYDYMPASLVGSYGETALMRRPGKPASSAPLYDKVAAQSEYGVLPVGATGAGMLSTGSAMPTYDVVMDNSIRAGSITYDELLPDAASHRSRE